MGKYWHIFKISIQGSLIYRFDFFASLLGEFISLAVLFYLWLSIYSQGNQVGSYSFFSLISYFVLSRLVAISTSADASRWVGDDINTGAIVNFLLKPIGYLGKSFFYYIGKITTKIIMFLPVAVAVSFFLKDQLDFTPIAIFYFGLFVFLGVIVNFLFFYLVGLLTFYFESIIGPSFLAWLLMYLFSGRIIPLDLLPGKLLTAVNLLPFKYISFVPIQIITGRFPMSNVNSEIFGALIWIIFLYFCAKFFFKIGMKSYESYGI